MLERERVRWEERGGEERRSEWSKEEKGNGGRKRKIDR